MIRTLIIWLTLLAVPFQGFASAAMLPCAPVAPAPAMQASHAHHQMQVAAGQQHDHRAMQQHRDADSKHAGNHAKCGNCAACCVGAALAPPPMAALAPHSAPGHAAPIHAGHVPSVDLDLPERPPRTARA